MPAQAYARNMLTTAAQFDIYDHDREVEAASE
jgi:hypothetical protein